MPHSKEDEQKLINNLRFFLKEDDWAIQFCIDLFYIAHLWDDLIDKDVDRSKDDIDAAFMVSLISIPQNPFYNKFKATLLPIMLNIILRWKDSNILDKGSDHDKHLSFGHRAGISEIINICAYLIGGPEWIKVHGPDIRRLYEEDLNDFMEEMKNA